VSKHFGATTALSDVTMRIAPGETHALVGRNGAGKSTLVFLLTGLHRPDGGRIDLSLAQDNGSVTVAVQDSGPGISFESRERLFRPFVSNSTGGTGLGLAIAKELSGALGGRIELESEPGHGARFELVLPAG